MKSDIQNIINETLMDEVRRTILEEKEGSGSNEVYHITCEGNPVDSFESEEDAYKHLDIYKDKHPEKEFIIEKQKYNSHSDMIDKLDEMGETFEVKETKTMEKKSIKVKNIAQAILDAKERGLSEIKVGGETYNVEESYKQLEEEEMCSECGDGPMYEELTGNQGELDTDDDGDIEADDLADLRAGKKEDVNEGEGHGECNECGSPMNEEGHCDECAMMNEMDDETVVTSFDDLGEGNDEEVITSLDQLSETKKIKLRLSENELVSLISRMVSEAVPGLDITKRVQKTSGDESKSHMSDVEKKLKSISTFDGNDNPEFPNQISKGTKVAQRTTDEENEEIEDNRGGGMEDLQYDYEPSERFKDRLKKALEGDSTMGNSHDAANVIATKTGENMGKKVERKAKKLAGETQVSWGHKGIEPLNVKTVNESKPTMSSVLEEEVKRMKNILGYNQKTQ